VCPYILVETFFVSILVASISMFAGGPHGLFFPYCLVDQEKGINPTTSRGK
jgi:H+/Cl- antiporter ClcA